MNSKSNAVAAWLLAMSCTALADDAPKAAMYPNYPSETPASFVPRTSCITRM